MLVVFIAHCYVRVSIFLGRTSHRHMTQPEILLYIMPGLNRERMKHELHPEDQVLKFEWEQPQLPLG